MGRCYCYTVVSSLGFLHPVALALRAENPDLDLANQVLDLGLWIYVVINIICHNQVCNLLRVVT